jgi:alpha-galactosidase
MRFRPETPGRSGLPGRVVRRAGLAALSVLTLCAVAVPAGASPACPPTTASTTVDQGAPAYYDSGLDPTPYMGWNTYYGTGAPTEATVVSVANFLISSGLRDAGYNYVWLDGGWTAPTPRDANGNLVADPAKFPHGLPWLVDYLHSRGLKAGIYTDAGASDGVNCAAGSLGYYGADTKQFAAWKFDAVKVDFLCGIAQKLNPQTVYTQFSAAIAQSGRRMLLNICDPVTSAWGDYPADEQAGFSYTFGPTVADSWRTDTDIAFGSPTPGEWPNVLRNMDDNEAHPEAEGPGHYNDPDFLLPMRVLPDGSDELTQVESTSQFAMWAEMGSPLIIGSDPRTLPTAMLQTLENPEILAVDQDPLAVQGVRVASSGSTDVYSKVLSGTGQRAVVLLNRGDTAAPITADFSTAGLSGTVSVRDLEARKDLGSFTGSYTATVPAHGTVMIRLHGTDYLPGQDLGAPNGSASASPALVRFDDTHALALTRAANGALAEQTLAGSTWPSTWTNLGGPTDGQILGQPAAYGSTGGRVDVFVRGTDNAAYQRTLLNGKWGGWVKLGGTLTDAPSVAFTSPNRWTLFARDGSGLVSSRTNNSGWTSSGAPNNAAIYGRPGAAVDSDGYTYLAVRAADDSVWERTQSPQGVWSDWTSLGGVVSGSPTLVSTLDRVYLFDRASDYTLWQVNHTDGAWGGWFERTEFPSNSVVGSVGAAAGANGSAWIAARGPDGLIHQTAL